MKITWHYYEKVYQKSNWRVLICIVYLELFTLKYM